MSDSKFSHISKNGEAVMVDVGGKDVSCRTARAEAVVELTDDIAERLKSSGGLEKGEIIETARIAGIMAAKQTPQLIPMCHPLPLDVVEVTIRLESSCLIIESTAKCSSTTGVEMEAMTAASVAALTVYDMCKSASKGITIRSTRLLEKTGGKSGTWTRSD